jgi:hypothetical protein
MASSRRAHQVVIKGLPSGESGLPLLPTLITSVNQHLDEGEGATSLTHGLPPQKGATSPRGAHLPRPTSSILTRFTINKIPITWIVFPLTFGLTFL